MGSRFRGADARDDFRLEPFEVRDQELRRFLAGGDKRWKRFGSQPAAGRNDLPHEPADDVAPVSCGRPRVTFAGLFDSSAEPRKQGLGSQIEVCHALSRRPAGRARTTKPGVAGQCAVQCCETRLRRLQVCDQRGQLGVRHDRGLYRSPEAD